jgi:hypothetical protein
MIRTSLNISMFERVVNSTNRMTLVGGGSALLRGRRSRFHFTKQAKPGKRSQASEARQAKLGKHNAPLWQCGTFTEGSTNSAR